MVLVANKVDLVHLRKVTNEQGCEMASKHNVSPTDIRARLYVVLTTVELNCPQFKARPVYLYSTFHTQWKFKVLYIKGSKIDI